MDINLFRKSLASKQRQLNESPKMRDLYDQIHGLHKAGGTKKMLEIANNVWSHLQSTDAKTKHPKLLPRLEALIDMLETGKVDPSEAEILQTEILADLRKMW